MKIRDSGMPDAQMWEGFFDAPGVLAALGGVDAGADVVEFGCGYGTFTVAAAALTRGTVHAFDIDPAMVAATRARAAALANVVVAERDCLAAGTGLPDASAGCALLFNILHAAQPLPLLREAFRVLRPGGRALVIHWVCDRPTPRGPALAIRPRPEQCCAWLEQVGFVITRREVDLPPWHYGVVGRRPAPP